MWAWGGVEGMAAGLLGTHGGDRWNTAVAVGVTAAAGIALVAIIVSSRRGGFKAPWRQRRRRKAPLTAQEWRGLFTTEGRFLDGGVKLLKKVRSGGIEPGIRAQVWPFILGVYSIDSSEAERDAVKARNWKGYQLLRKHCLQKSAYSMEESKQPTNKTLGVKHEGSLVSEKGKDFVGSSTVESEEVAEKSSVVKHVVSEEGNLRLNTEEEVVHDTSETKPEQMDEDQCSSSSSSEEESEKSVVTVEASHQKDVPPVCEPFI